MTRRGLRVVVMLGGPSAEREVSLRSGAAVSRALRSLGHSVTEIDPRDPWVLPPETEVVFLALHGTYGEDGAVQSELDALGVAYTGCDAAASRTAFDKIVTKKRCVAAGVPTPPFDVLTDAEASWPAGWEPPWVLKPACQGSSVGLAFVDTRERWSGALREALNHGTPVVVERRILGREVTVAILDGKALPLVEVRPRAGGYDYTNKYTPGATEYFCPAPLDPAVAARVQSEALAAFRAVGGRDYARVDVMLDGDLAPWVLEVNTLPGMTETSLFPKAAAAAGLDFCAVCQRMLDLASARANRGQAINHVA